MTVGILSTGPTVLKLCVAFCGENKEIDKDMIHNKNGWTLIYSPDKEVMKKIKKPEDNSVERIEINDIQWFRKTHKYPEHMGDGDPNPNNFQDIPLETPMKMILEIPKEG